MRLIFQKIWLPEDFEIDSRVAAQSSCGIRFFADEEEALAGTDHAQPVSRTKTGCRGADHQPHGTGASDRMAHAWQVALVH